MREEIGFGSKCCLLPSAIVKGRLGCRLLAAERRQDKEERLPADALLGALQEAAGAGAARSSAGSGKGQ